LAVIYYTQLRINTYCCTSAERAKSGRFHPGIHEANFDAAARWAEAMGYHGPLVLGTDDTVLTAALDSFQSNGVWYLVGMHGAAAESFSSYEELMAKATISKEQLATKVS
jgi:hypothetical protein